MIYLSKKCPECNTYNRLDSSNCRKCNKDISIIDPMKVDDQISSLSQEDIQVIKADKIYRQICPRCGKEYYMTDINNKLSICQALGCRKRQISKVIPEEYDPNLEKVSDKDSKNNLLNQENNGDRGDTTNQGNKVLEEDSQYEDSRQAAWGNILAGINNIENQTEGKLIDQAEDKTESPIINRNENFSVSKSILKLLPLEETIARYGEYQCEIENGDVEDKLIIGRNEMMGQYLEQNKKTSRRHCGIFFLNNRWYLEDMESTNGTMVNSVLYKKEKNNIKRVELHPGDIISLGYERDSFRFMVKIEEA
ncbi:MAG: FHA domain-containing protein [Eubacterium sp.]|nr:FHA domain-containing protein [Eubacterium sp.]